MFMHKRLLYKKKSQRGFDKSYLVDHRAKRASSCTFICMKALVPCQPHNVAIDGRGPDRCEKRRDRAQRGTFPHHEHEIQNVFQAVSYLHI